MADPEELAQRAEQTGREDVTPCSTSNTGEGVTWPEDRLQVAEQMFDVIPSTFSAWFPCRRNVGRPPPTRCFRGGSERWRTVIIVLDYAALRLAFRGWVRAAANGALAYLHLDL